MTKPNSKKADEILLLLEKEMSLYEETDILSSA
jgi:hypothetical protein